MKKKDAYSASGVDAIVKPSYYFLKSRDAFQEGDEFLQYDWSSLWTKIDPAWIGHRKGRFLSYRCKVRRTRNDAVQV